MLYTYFIYLRSFNYAVISSVYFGIDFICQIISWMYRVSVFRFINLFKRSACMESALSCSVNGWPLYFHTAKFDTRTCYR
jgi:hypothetical protein